MITREPHLTRMDLDQIDLGQLSPDDILRVDAHSARCASCAARRAEHARQVLHFRNVVFPRSAARLPSRARPALRWRWSYGLALPLAASVLLLARGSQTTPPAAPEAKPQDGILGIKGAPLLQVFARHKGPGAAGAEVTKVADGERLAPGDALRFVLSATGLPYVMVTSIDGAGHSSIYYPYQGESSAEVVGQGTVSVPGSIVLDQAPGPERLFVIYSKQPLPAAAAREALAALAAGGASAIRAAQRLAIADTIQATLLFEKEDGQ
jgi:hypothetical protein